MSINKEKTKFNTFRLPTKKKICSCTHNEYSEDLKIPKAIDGVPIELENILTFKEYERIVKTCKRIISLKMFTDKLYYITFAMGIAAFFLYFPFLYTRRKLLILAMIAVVSFILLVGLALSRLTIIKLKAKLDQKIQILNNEFKEKNIIIEREVKKEQVSSMRTKNHILINIIYNIQLIADQSNSTKTEESLQKEIKKEIQVIEKSPIDNLIKNNNNNSNNDNNNNNSSYTQLNISKLQQPQSQPIEIKIKNKNNDYQKIEYSIEIIKDFNVNLKNVDDHDDDDNDVEIEMDSMNKANFEMVSNIYSDDKAPLIV
ncbi:hypothetical protein ACTFIR_006801 [Dictyostelium discoideum]